MKAMILTGGLGTRLRPLTLNTLKPLLPLVNLPILYYPLALLRKHGIHEAILCTSDSSRPYRGLIQEQKRLGTEVRISGETKMLGTAGAFKNAEKFTDTSPFFALNGDILTNLDLSRMLQFHHEKKSLITIALVPLADPSHYGLVQTDSNGRILTFLEKPPVNTQSDSKNGISWVNAGYYIFNKEMLELVRKNKICSLEREIFPYCIEKNLPLYGFQSSPSTYWMDIGTPGKYLQANIDVVHEKYSGVYAAEDLSPKGKNCVIHPTAVLSENSVVGRHCKIGSGSVLIDCVLLDHTVIGNEVQLEGCVIGSRCKIGSHTRISRHAVVGDHSQIKPYSRL